MRWSRGWRGIALAPGFLVANALVLLGLANRFRWFHPPPSNLDASIAVDGEWRMGFFRDGLVLSVTRGEGGRLAVYLARWTGCTLHWDEVATTGGYERGLLTTELPLSRAESLGVSERYYAVRIGGIETLVPEEWRRDGPVWAPWLGESIERGGFVRSSFSPPWDPRRRRSAAPVRLESGRP